VLAQELFRDRPGRDPADGFTGTGTAATAAGAGAVLGLVGKIGMGRSGHLDHFAIIAGTLVLVVNQQADRRAEGQAVFHPREDGDPIRFFARRGQVALAGTAAIELRLDIGFGQLQTGRTAIDDGAHTYAV
jgi:hypothetical protein